jgi:hypothetical protein
MDACTSPGSCACPNSVRIDVSQQNVFQAIKRRYKRNRLLRHLMLISLRSNCTSCTLVKQPAFAESNSVYRQEIAMPDQKALAESPVKAEDTVEETLVQAHDALTILYRKS